MPKDDNRKRKSHAEKKSGSAHDTFKQQRRAENAKKGKQVYMDGKWVADAV